MDVKGNIACFSDDTILLINEDNVNEVYNYSLTSVNKV